MKVPISDANDKKVVNVTLYPPLKKTPQQKAKERLKSYDSKIVVNKATPKKKAEVLLRKYIDLLSDSSIIKTSDIKRFQDLIKNSIIVLSLGVEELNINDEVVGYLEFIPSSFSDVIRVAFVRCSKDKFNEERKSQNVINRIFRLMMPVFVILQEHFDIKLDTVISFAKGEIPGPIVINRTTPIEKETVISKGILQLSDLADELCAEPVDMVVLSCRDNIWDLSFSDGRLLRVDSQGQKEHSLNVIKHELLNHGYFIHEPAFDNYMKKADFTKNLFFKKNWYHFHKRQ